MTTGIQAVSDVRWKSSEEVSSFTEQESVSAKKSMTLPSSSPSPVQARSRISESDFVEACEREFQKAHAAAENACVARDGFTKVLKSEAGPKIPTGKSEAKAAAEIAQAKAECEVADAKWSHGLAAVSALTAHHPANELLRKLDNEVNALPEEAHRAAAAAGVMRSPLPSAAPGAAGDHTPGSYGDFWDKLSSAIGGLKTDYLGVYEKAVEKNNAFYRDFTKFVSDSVKWTVGDKDITLTLDDDAPAVTDAQVDAEFSRRYPTGSAAMVALISRSGGLMGAQQAIAAEKRKIRSEFESVTPGNRTGFLVALREIMNKYTPSEGRDNGVLVSVEADPKDGAQAEAIAEAKAKKWASDMGLPQTSVKQNPSVPGQWWVVVDLTPVDAMIKQLEALSSPGDKKITLTPARHNTWQSGMETQKEQLKATASTLGQKMAGAQSIYENLIKVLTSTISAMLDTARSFQAN